MEKKFEVKDLITVGIFTALYFAITFAVACIGFIPIFMVFMPLLVMTAIFSIDTITA